MIYMDTSPTPYPLPPLTLPVEIWKKIVYHSIPKVKSGVSLIEDGNNTVIIGYINNIPILSWYPKQFSINYDNEKELTLIKDLREVIDRQRPCQNNKMQIRVHDNIMMYYQTKPNGILMLSGRVYTEEEIIAILDIHEQALQLDMDIRRKSNIQYDTNYNNDYDEYGNYIPPFPPSFPPPAPSFPPYDQPYRQQYNLN